MEILLSQESSYFSHNPLQINFTAEKFRLEDINENVPGYDNHN